MCCYYLPKVNTSAFALSFMRPKNVFYNYLRVLVSKFRLDGFKFSQLCYLLSMEKTDNNEHEIECASNLVEL